MKVTIKDFDDITVVEVEGNIDSKTAPEFERNAKLATDKSNTIAIDLTAVEFMSSAGLRVLLMLYRNVKAKERKSGFGWCFRRNSGCDVNDRFY